MPRKLLYLLAAAIPFIIYTGARKIYQYYNTPPVLYKFTQDEYMVATAELQTNLPIDTGDIVFVGNSLTSNWPLMEMFGSMKYKNRGIASNTTAHILRRIKFIAQSCPSVIFVEGGVNDFFAGISAAQSFENFKQIIDVVKTTSPHTRLIIESTFPVCMETTPLMKRIDSLNNLLKEYCRDKVEFLDLQGIYRKNNALDSSLTWDGVHLNYEGYKRWRDTVRAVLGRWPRTGPNK